VPRGRMTAGGRLSFRRRLYVGGVPPENTVPGANHLLLQQPAQLGGDSARAESTLRNRRLRLNRVAVSQLGSFTVFLVALSTSILPFLTPFLFVFSPVFPRGCTATPCCVPDVAVVFAERFITGGQWEEGRAVIGLHGHPPRSPLAADTPPGCPAPTAPAGGGGPARCGDSGGARGGGPARGGDRGGDGRRGAAQQPRGVAVAAAWEHGTWKKDEDLRSLFFFLRLSI
jgi:hypothetical protein